MIVDYPWQHPGGAALVGAGVVGVLRYLSHDATKTLMRPEADDLAAHGIGMAVVFEDMADRAKDGYTAGANDATVALGMLDGTRSGYTDLSMPADRPIYFAADFDCSWPQVAQYYAGCASVLGRNRVGVYGGLSPIAGAANAGYHWLWQASAWSHGVWNANALLRQRIQTVKINGVECDVDDATTEDWGQWTPGGDMPLSPQDLTAIRGVVDEAIQAQRGQQQADNLWWLDHALSGSVPPGASPAAAAAIKDINALISKLGPKP